MQAQGPSVSDRIKSILDSARTLLSGEAARFIGYGAAVVIVGVVALANQLGFTRFGANLSLSDAVIGATAAITVVVGLIESIRRFVYSENTVKVIAAEAAKTGDAMIPPPPADDADEDTDVAVDPEQGNG